MKYEASKVTVMVDGKPITPLGGFEYDPFESSQLGWLRQPGFQYKADLEGYRDFVFGGRAGPSIDLDNLIHEVGHAIICSIDNELWRLDQRNYGLHIREEWVIDRWVAEPLTNQASLLECRVFAVQKIILESLGVFWEVEKQPYGRKEWPTYYHDKANILRFMPDWWFKTNYVNAIRVYELTLSLEGIQYHWNRVCSYINDQLQIDVDKKEIVV